MAAEAPFRVIKVHPNGTKRVVVELGQNEALVLIKPNRHYRIGSQIDEVYPSHVFEEIEEVFWNYHEQKWDTN